MLRDKIIVVTGAAKGMGEAHAAHLARQGAHVVMTDVDEAGSETARRIRDAGGSAEFHRLDVVDEHGWRALVDSSVSRHGKVDGLVNNAGILVRKPVDELSGDDWDALFDVNVKGTFLGCKHVLPAMQRAGGGSIVNVSSISGMVANMPGMSAYCATKGAIRLFTKGLAVDYARYNIRANSVHPGTIRTPMTADFERDPEQLRMLLGTTILGRLGEATEVSEVVAFLLSGAASFMTGAEVMVDGGFTAV